MIDPRSLTNVQFANALTPQSVQITRVIHAAIMAGPVFFLMIIIALSSQQTGGVPPLPSNVEIINTLSMVHVGIALAAFLLSSYLSAALFSPDRLGGEEEPMTAEMLASKCVVLQRSAAIARLALLEGAAFFGLAICLLGVVNHVIQAEPSYWLNATSTGFFLIYAATVFPTRESLIGWFDRAFGGR